MGESAIAKEPRQHRLCACLQHLIDEWLLPFEHLRRTTTGQWVLARLSIRNLRIEFCNGSQPGRVTAVCGVQRLAEHILTAACVVAKVEPVDSAVIRSGDRRDDRLPRRPCIDTPNNQVGTCRIGSQRIFVKVLRVTISRWIALSTSENVYSGSPSANRPMRPTCGLIDLPGRHSSIQPGNGFTPGVRLHSS